VCSCFDGGLVRSTPRKRNLCLKIFKHVGCRRRVDAKLRVQPI
jgi:hypothetical protein